MLEMIPLVILMVVIAASIHGYAGFGFGIISMALVALLPVNLERASVVITLTSISVILGLLLLSRRHDKIHWLQVALILPGGFLGVPIGYWFIAQFGDQPVFRLILAMALIAFSLNGLIRREPPKPRPLPAWTALPVGLLSGFLGGAFVSGGPPIIIYLYSRTTDPREMKPTIQATFLSLSSFRLLTIGFGEKGLTQGGVLWISLAAVPIVLCVLVLGHRFSRGHSVENFRRAIYYLIMTMGFIIIARTFWL